MNSEILYKQASLLIQNNISLCTSDDAWSIAHALQLLIEANKLELGITPLKIKIITSMARCNYLIDNLIYAYNCAIIAKKKINGYIEANNQYDSLTKITLEEENCNKIIEAVKHNLEGSLAFYIMDEDHVLATCKTYNIRKTFPPKNEAPFNKDDIYHLIHAIEKIKNATIAKSYSNVGNIIAMPIESIFNMYKYALYYIWQMYMFGKDEDVWIEGESIMPYHMFISNIKEHTDTLLSILHDYNPFASYKMNNANISQLLYKILNDLQRRLHEGRI